MNIAYETILEQVRACIANAVNVPVVIGPLPPTGGVGVTMASGPVDRDLAGNAMVKMRIGINVKLATQQDAAAAISDAHAALADFTAEGNSWQITGCSVQSTPAAVRQESDGSWLVLSTCTVRATFYSEV